MADTPTSRLKLRLQTLASNVNLWGDPYLNNNDIAVDYAFSVLPFPVGSATSTTFTSTNYGTANQTQPLAVNFTGTGTQTLTATMPLVSFIKYVMNDSGGPIQMIGATGTGVTVPAGSYYWVRSDSTNWSNATPPLDKLRPPTGQMNFNNQILGSAAPGTATSHGATLGNRLDQFQQPTSAVAFGTQRITSVGSPTATQDAATKGYVDTVVTSAAGVPIGSGTGQLFFYNGTAVGWGGTATSSGLLSSWNGAQPSWSTPTSLNIGVTTALSTWSQPQVARVGTFTWATNNLLNFGTAQYWYSSATSGGTIGRATNVTAGMSGVIELLYSTAGTSTVALDTTFWKSAGTSAFNGTKVAGSRDLIAWIAQANGTAVTYSPQYGVGP